MDVNGPESPADGRTGRGKATCLVDKHEFRRLAGGVRVVFQRPNCNYVTAYRAALRIDAALVSRRSRLSLIASALCNPFSKDPPIGLTNRVDSRWVSSAGELYPWRLESAYQGANALLSGDILRCWTSTTTWQRRHSRPTLRRRRPRRAHGAASLLTRRATLGAPFKRFLRQGAEQRPIPGRHRSGLYRREQLMGLQRHWSAVQRNRPPATQQRRR